MPSSSEAAKLDNLLKAQKRCPEDQPGLAIYLYHDVFSHFLADFNDISSRVPTKFYHHVARLFGASLQVWPDEKTRLAHIQGPLDELLESPFTAILVDGSKPDGHARLSCNMLGHSGGQE